MFQEVVDRTFPKREFSKITLDDKDFLANFKRERIKRKIYLHIAKAFIEFIFYLYVDLYEEMQNEEFNFEHFDSLSNRSIENTIKLAYQVSLNNLIQEMHQFLLEYSFYDKNNFKR